MKKNSAILGPDGRPVNAERVKIDRESRFNALADWTPDVLTRQLLAFSRGRLSGLAWVMEWLEKHDDTISTVAPKAKAAVSRHGHDIVFADGLRKDQKQAAEDQREYLEGFYANLETGDALELEESGGMRLLVQQVMDAYGKTLAAHHIIWKPTKDGLRAKLVKVPLWFFESSTGRLRFLPTQFSYDGVDLATLGGRSAWMVSKGRGVLLAGAIARMFKQIPLQDWLTYCDRHGMPAFLGKTNAKKGDAGWNEMRDAVASLGAEFGAVINTSDSIDVLSLAAQGELPYEKLVDRMDRSQVMLWRGGDLSTMSRGGGAVGSNPQMDETDELDADNAAWVEETLNANLTKQVIAYRFGKDAPVLAKLKLRTKTRVNVTEELATVKAARELGVRISASWFVNRFGITEADKDESALGETSKIQNSTIKEESEIDALNTSPDTQELFAKSLAKAVGVSDRTLDPVRPVMERLAAGVQDGGMSDAEWLQGFEELALELPEFFNPKLAAEMAEELEGAMGTAIVNGVRSTFKSQNSTPKED